MQTLAIIIATEGAKAKDQQGRLSEGDIQRELVAFKSESGSIEAQLASLETYEATVELIKDELAVYDGIIAEGVIGKEQLELLRAAKKVNNAKNAFRSTYGLGTTGGTIQTGDEFTETLGFIDDGAAQFYDLDSFNANKPSSVPSIVRIGTDSMANTLYELEDGRVVYGFEFQKRYQISPDFVGSAGSQPPTGGATTTPPGGTGGTTTPPPPPGGTGGTTTPPPPVPQPPATQPPLIGSVGGSIPLATFYNMLNAASISNTNSVSQAGNMIFPGLDGEYKIVGNDIVRVK